MSDFTVVAGTSPAYTFVGAHRVLRAETLAGAEQALDEAEAALDDGYWIAGYITYERDIRLGIFDAPQESTPALNERIPASDEILGESESFRMSPLQPLLTPDEYGRAIERIHHAIYEGDVYQVNYTVPFAFSFEGDPWDTYHRFALQSGARYCAFIRDHDRTLLSFSPELFLEFEGTRLVTKPMKGTAPLDRIAELDSDKNRAEHLMIVDLLRNDFHRIGLDVSVKKLFEYERYPTFATMTSTIAGQAQTKLPPLKTIWRSVFPCGSVTGAPKIAAMQQIAALELQPRGAYCGSIGFLSPRRKGWWNVAIRTAQLDCSRGIGRYDAGGGIVSDSRAEGEWAEVLLKTRFFREHVAPFELLETFSSDAMVTPAPRRRTGSASAAVAHGGAGGGLHGALRHSARGDMEGHLARLRRTASIFDIPFDGMQICDEIERAQRESTMRKKVLIRLRLAGDGTPRVFLEPLISLEEPVRVCVSDVVVQSDDPMLRWKTSWRPAYERAAKQARDANCFEALLLNERGEITEGTRTNVFVRMDGQLYTPPLTCGVLPGILRHRLVEGKTAVEKALRSEDLRLAQELYVGNSARGLLQARLVESRIPAL